MKIKHKRLIIIGCCIAWGMTTLSLLVFGYPMHNRLPSGNYGEPTIVGYICYISCSIIREISRALQEYPNLLEFIVLFVTQFLIYAILGIIISYAAYPPWRKTKTLPESPEAPPDK
jgi:hypothetical protein